MMLENLPDRSKKRDRDDAFGPSALTSQKRVNYNKDQPQSDAEHHTPSKASAETTATTAAKPTMAAGPKGCPDCKPGETNGRCPKHKKHNNPGRNKRKREAKERLLRDSIKDLSKPVIDEDSFEHRHNDISRIRQQEYRMARSISPDGGVPIDEETLAKLRSHHHNTLDCDDDSSDDDCSHDNSLDDHSPRGRLPGSQQAVEPLQPRKGHSQAHARRQFRPDHQHNTNKNDQTAALSYASSLPVFNHQQGSFVAEPSSSMVTYQPFRGIQSAQPLEAVALNPRIGMAVEGGKLYLAQTLHHYYRKHIHCPRHDPVDGRPGHHRTVKKVHETGQVYRVWFCTSQPKGEGHRIDNTDYIKLAITRLDRALFDQILHEVIRQLRFRDCQPIACNRSPQPDDFDYDALLQYVNMPRLECVQEEGA